LDIVVIVNVEVPGALNEAGTKLAVAPVGNPAMPNVTLPLKSVLVVMVTV
jgi:hypothetical protein